MKASRGGAIIPGWNSINFLYEKFTQDTPTPSKTYFLYGKSIGLLNRDIPIKLGEGVKWAGKGNVGKYHRDIVDSFKNETRCIDIDKYYCQQRVCFIIDHANFYANPKVQISYPEDCKSSKPCTIRSEWQHSQGITFSYPLNNIEELNFFVYSGIKQSLPYIKNSKSIASTSKKFNLLLPPHQTGIMAFQAISWLIRGHFIFEDRNKCDFVVPDKIDINFPILVDGFLNGVYSWDEEQD